MGGICRFCSCHAIAGPWRISPESAHDRFSGSGYMERCVDRTISAVLCRYLFWMGNQKGLEFLTAYLIEKSLSIDNVFVWMVLFSYFCVPAQYQHRVLFLGVLGAILTRGVFIAAGITLLNVFHWLLYIFGAFLIFTGIRLALRKDKETHPERNPVLKLVRRFLPVTSEYHEQRFFIRHAGTLMATPLFMVLLVVETTDIVFAVDSIPAVLGITKDAFIVWSSNIMAILGLRALYFLVVNILSYFRYLKVGLALVLCFVGVKMILTDFVHISTPVALGAIAGILALTMLASYLAERLYFQTDKAGVDGVILPEGTCETKPETDDRIDLTS
jgi:tellurite resistance protein TerC